MTAGISVRCHSFGGWNTSLVGDQVKVLNGTSSVTRLNQFAAESMRIFIVCFSALRMRCIFWRMFLVGKSPTYLQRKVVVLDSVYTMYPR